MRKIVSAIILSSLLMLASGQLPAKSLLDEAKDRNHVEFDIGYETVGSVVLEMTPFLFAVRKDLKTGKEQINNLPITIPIGFGYDIVKKKYMFRIGYFDRCFFDDSNGIRFTAFISLDTGFKKKEKEGDPVDLAVSTLLGAGYVRKNADDILVNADVGWKHDFMGSSDSVFGRVTISLGYRPLIAY